MSRQFGLDACPAAGRPGLRPTAEDHVGWRVLGFRHFLDRLPRKGVRVRPAQRVHTPGPGDSCDVVLTGHDARFTARPGSDLRLPWAEMAKFEAGARSRRSGRTVALSGHGCQHSRDGSVTAAGAGGPWVRAGGGGGRRAGAGRVRCGAGRGGRGAGWERGLSVRGDGGHKSCTR